ncbi:hypothetical protein CY34DRAFT_26852 [Suillus luteus UH-Slu-Lm8-n1]|uniref:Uncharacterized protein n=1 Tax=Suillus luteus UH-Slu-Lm8-n1 TaxID=930992 RepID=A0A0D0A8M6_9AGAM|nr:hypothetical protein CY34DRAFT_26852 [Suillus luteus UH-Slu-Lm8-n1]
MTWTSAGAFNHTERKVSGNGHSFDSIDWEDPLLYTIPLSAEELQAINADTSFPELRDPSIANLSSASDTCGSVPPSRIPSPIENTRSDPLRDANSSTWAARNPTRSVIRARTPPPRLSNAQKASRKVKHDQKMETTKRLHDAVALYLDEQKLKIGSLSRAHNVTPKYINDIIGSHTKYRTTRKVQLTNTLIHAKAKEMNTDQPVGSRYTLVELREMVTNDPQMKELTKDEKAGYIAALSEHREQNITNVRGNNMAAARDVLLTTERVVKELDDLRIRTGTYATIFVVRGHINDTIQSSMHGTDNSEDFWEDVYDIPMADYLRQYEQWACTQNQNLNERDSLEAVRKQVRKMIVRGLIAVTGKKNIIMNYSNYETAVVETYAVRLIGWPASIKFINPSNIGTVGDIRKLRDALKARTCYWTALTPVEVKAHTAELDVRRSAGEVVRKPRKKRSDAGGSRKRKALPAANGKNKRPSKKARKMAAGSSSEAPKSVEFIVSSGEEEEDFEAM